LTNWYARTLLDPSARYLAERVGRKSASVHLNAYLAAAIALVSVFGPALGVPVERAEATAQSESARTFTVANPSEYHSLAANLKPGDTVILKNGVWQDFDLRLEGEGTAKAPIRLRAETPGRVILSGRSRLRIGGQYLDVSGLVFRDGYAPQDEVIAFRIGNRVANDSRVSETVIDGYNRPREAVGDNDSWVALFGLRNRFDHDHIVGKTTPGVTLAVRTETEAAPPTTTASTITISVPGRRWAPMAAKPSVSAPATIRCPIPPL
jgi:hypothetical protein